MNKKLILTTICLALYIQGKTQTPNNYDIQVYGVAGKKFLGSKSFFYPQNVSPKTTSSLGGGVVFQKSKVQIGMELVYSKGTSHENKLHAVHSGMEANLLGGYKLCLSDKFYLVGQLGFGYTLNHLYVTDELFNSPNNLNSTIFHNNSYTLPLALSLQRELKNGMFLGFKTGYTFLFSQGNNWRHRHAGNTRHFNVGSEGVFIQIIFGGLMNKN